MVTFIKMGYSRRIFYIFVDTPNLIGNIAL